MEARDGEDGESVFVESRWYNGLSEFCESIPRQVELSLGMGRTWGPVTYPRIPRGILTTAQGTDLPWEQHTGPLPQGRLV